MHVYIITYVHVYIITYINYFDIYGAVVSWSYTEVAAIISV